MFENVDIFAFTDGIAFILIDIKLVIVVAMLIFVAV